MTDVPDANAGAPAPSLRPELLNWCEAWKIGLQNVISQVSGQIASFEISVVSLPTADSDVWYTVVAKGTVNGEMTIRLPADSGTRLARKFLGAPEPTATDSSGENITARSVNAKSITAENKEAVEELLRQIAGLTSTGLATAVGGEVQLHVAASAAPSWSSAAVVCLQTRDEAGTSVTIEIQISAALGAELQTRAAAANSEKPLPLASALSSAGAASASASASRSVDSPAASNYRRLMDVGLDVKLRFGSRRMSLRDVLALSAGVVVELENTLHSPVDLLLDGRLIAQGDVVIIDGKYGLRVTNVIDPPSISQSPA